MQLTQSRKHRREDQILYFEGQSLNKKQILHECTRLKDDLSIKGDLFRFLHEWFNEQETLSVQTSGSTGAPKNLKVDKVRMVQSALFTCNFLGLEKGHTTLLCMPLKYIGAKMLVVRALVAGLELYIAKPSLQPFTGIDKTFDFVPMTPQQVWACLEDPKSLEQLKHTRHLLLGGMAVSSDLQKKLCDFPHNVWSSYGMTETLSHIALRKINGAQASAYFTPFSAVKLHTSEDGRLIIDAPMLCESTLTTNDLVELLPNGNFRVLGRLDNVINSGGIKIHLEHVEEDLRKHFTDDLMLTAIYDENLGEKLVLLMEKNVTNWQEQCATLPKYNRPKKLIVVEKLPYTETGKPNRHEAKKLAQTFDDHINLT